ncbi:Methyltransferase ausD [Psilocybe cubensis]|uniref:Methyltransferase ausD n=2 Tax=Psilocybe cubensis TaxID=181762 RepID=A0A8H8CMN8_PSICU|nr:Methyltransferase ausD [Psilocybe cubensis]KAH9481459.1 Methyltransferase ausD [Psilocybe cubensis]
MMIYAHPNTRPKLDPSRYSIQEDERQFYELLTGIHDEEELKAHIVAVQAKAYQVFGYPCIRLFSFMRLTIARLSAYPKVLKLLEQRKDPILLDLGCCFGNDSRKAMIDGWPIENIVASDLRQEFWECGHELFKSTPASFPVAFIAGDVFDSSMLDMESDTQADPDSIRPLRNLTSLSPLKHKVSAIHVSALFHLFDEDHQRDLAHRLASLLLLEKGSIIFGQHGAQPEMGTRLEIVRMDGTDSEIGQHTMFCHSPESWKKLWEEDIFGPGSLRHRASGDSEGEVRVKVEAKLKLIERWDFVNTNTKFYFMDWSVEVL